MTTIETIIQLDSIIDTYEILVGHGVNSDILDVDDIDAIRTAMKLIKAIEDIKSEIKELSELDHAEPTYEDCKRDVLEIIDKHISGKENTDADSN